MLTGVRRAPNPVTTSRCAPRPVGDPADQAASEPGSKRWLRLPLTDLPVRPGLGLVVLGVPRTVLEDHVAFADQFRGPWRNLAPRGHTVMVTMAIGVGAGLVTALTGLATPGHAVLPLIVNSLPEGTSRDVARF